MQSRPFLVNFLSLSSWVCFCCSSSILGGVFAGDGDACLLLSSFRVIRPACLLVFRSSNKKRKRKKEDEEVRRGRRGCLKTRDPWKKRRDLAKSGERKWPLWARSCCWFARVAAFVMLSHLARFPLAQPQASPASGAAGRTARKKQASKG